MGRQTVSQDDQSYFRRRLRDEENAATRAICDAARERHEELAAAYRLRLQFGRLHDLISRSHEASEANSKELINARVAEPTR